MTRRYIVPLALASALVAGRVEGQQMAAAPAGPAVGSVAPDFTLPTVTRYGKLASPTRLADLKGQTIVIAFFYKARTKG
jgi:thioredoxin-dependent peroxiredoxin